MKMASKSTTNTSAMDSRKELSELIKRKAEISVNKSLFTFPPEASSRACFLH